MIISHKKLNNSGKVLTIFIVITFILMLSLIAIAGFQWHQEQDARKRAEISLEEMKQQGAKLEAELKEAKKQSFLLEEKNKEISKQLEDTLDELNLEKGLREEAKDENAKLKEENGNLKDENASVKDALQKESQAKTAFQEELNTKLKESQQKVADLEKQLQDAKQRIEELQKQTQLMELPKMDSTAPQMNPANAATPLQSPIVNPSAKAQQVQLDKIVITPNKQLEGRILTVDAETEFVIFNLGQKDAIAEGNVLSVYHNKEYLGDIKVSRVQPEMSAADFVPPLTAQKVQKDDRVIPKSGT